MSEQSGEVFGEMCMWGDWRGVHDGGPFDIEPARHPDGSLVFPPREAPGGFDVRATAFDGLQSFLDAKAQLRPDEVALGLREAFSGQNEDEEVDGGTADVIPLFATD